MESKKLFKYGEFEGEVNFSNPDFVDKWEVAMTRVQQESAKKVDKEKTSDMMRRIIRSILGVFDDIFGKGSSDKIFGESVGMDEAVDAFDALAMFGNEQSASSSEKWAKVASRYAPNRSQRRAAK